MSLEPGGRADKYGNEYENLYLAELYIKLCCGKITSITVERLGPDHDSVEYSTEQKDGISKHYQCKASNGSKDYWTFSDLAGYDVFARAREIVSRDVNNEYYFISPLSYSVLTDLCKRSKTNGGTQEFFEYQLTNDKIKKYCKDIAENLGLDLHSPADRENLRNLLMRCHFESYSSGIESKESLEERIAVRFTGNPSTIRNLLQNYAVDTDSIGRKIIATDIVTYLDQRGFYQRNYGNSKTVVQRIKCINEDYYGPFPAINNQLFHREATDIILAHIKNGKSVIVHGKAGSGKSGCLQEIREKLEQENIPFISIKLDAKVPAGSADEYGKSMGLPESPVACLATLSAGKPAVLILDQLDALRWTNIHSGDALTVCKELIHQCKAINEYENGHISIIFASRTFDLENDAGLKSLFDLKTENEKSMWEKVSVTLLSSEELVRIIGTRYHHLSARMKKLLLTPSTLFVWTQLDRDERKRNITSVQKLMQAWWQKILRQCEKAGVEEKRITKCKNKIVQLMETRARFVLPLEFFDDFTKEIDILVSTGLLNRNHKKTISFSHQSFLDYFITKDYQKRIYERESLVDIIWEYDEQTPFVRYRLLALLQSLIETDTEIFAEEAKKLLESNKVRYYFKCAVFEIIGQYPEPDDFIYDLLDEYIGNPDWEKYIFRVVLLGHPQYIKRLPVFSRTEWFDDTTLNLLRSITDSDPDFVADKLNPFVSEEDTDRNNKLWNAIYHDGMLDSDKLFQLRKRLLNINPQFFTHIRVIADFIEGRSPRAIELLNMVLQNWPRFDIKEIYCGDQKQIDAFINQYSSQIVTDLLPTISMITKECAVNWPSGYLNMEFWDWRKEEYNETAVRNIVEIVKKAIEHMASASPDCMLKNFIEVENSSSVVVNELIMCGIEKLPISYSNKVILWIIEKFDARIFVYTDDSQDFLLHTKTILRRFTPYCSDDAFEQIEEIIYNWHESIDEMVWQYRHRLETNREGKYEPMYYAYWGHLQKALLPCLASNRISRKASALIDVLNRNTWIPLKYFYSGFTSEAVFCPESPVSKCLSRISDKTWIQIVSTPEEKLQHRWKMDGKGNCIVVDHNAFSDSLARQAKIECSRFARLALLFPADCSVGYITKLFYALSEEDAKEPAEQKVMCQLIRRNLQRNDYNVIKAILHYIEKKSEQIWPQDILEQIVQLSMHRDPEPNEYLSDEDRAGKEDTASFLYTKSLNCIRGSAAYTITKLLWSHKDLFGFFRETAEKLLADPNAAVRIGCSDMILPYYNEDPQFAVYAMDELVKRDCRVICMPAWWEVTIRKYTERPDHYRNILISACKSPHSKVSNRAARLLCAVAICKDDTNAMQYICSNCFSKEQQEEICRQAVSTFGTEKYHVASETILTHMISCADGEISELAGLFSEKKIVIQRDQEFLKYLMKHTCSERVQYKFVKYLSENDVDIREYIDVIALLAKNLNTENGLWRLTDEDLIKCVIRLFDRCKNDKQIRIRCLDIWDDLFRSNVQEAIFASDMLSDME